MRAVVELTHSDGVQERCSLPPGRYIVGGAGAHLVLRAPDVAPRHAELWVEPGVVMIVDLGSSAGTWMAEGQRLFGSLRLMPGRSVRAGSAMLRVLEFVHERTGTQSIPQYNEELQRRAVSLAPTQMMPSVAPRSPAHSGTEQLSQVPPLHKPGSSS